jgi:hypothetical protein
MSEILNAHSRELINSVCGFFNKEVTPVVLKKLGYLLAEYETKISKPPPPVVKIITRTIRVRAAGYEKAIKPFASPEILDKVAKKVCNEFAITLDELQGDMRDTHYVNARQYFTICIKRECIISHKEVGDFLGGRDHTTITHYLKYRKKSEPDITEIAA